MKAQISLGDVDLMANKMVDETCPEQTTIFLPQRFLKDFLKNSPLDFANAANSFKPLEWMEL